MEQTLRHPGSTPKNHPSYVMALDEYNRGLLLWPPCESCAEAIPYAPFTGATHCEDCFGKDKLAPGDRVVSIHDGTAGGYEGGAECFALVRWDGSNEAQSVDYDSIRLAT
jgi:hypothetical protein